MTETLPPEDAVLSPADYQPDRSLPAKLRRRLTKWQTARKLGPMAASIVTFSFDDFPKSAADTGAEIMEIYGASAIYYACSGLVGGRTLTGEQYTDEDIALLLQAGHEIGAHTHTHLDCARAPVDRVIYDIARNLAELEQMGVPGKIQHFAYPYGETTFALKTSLTSKFETCRGILPGHNTQTTDAMQLSAMELTPDEATTARAINAIEKARHTPGWLHIFTHDVSNSPSPFGTRPASLKAILEAARLSDLQILTPRQVFQSQMAA